jgi:hypothetical protein
VTFNIALLSAASSVAALNFGAALVFRRWLGQQAATLQSDSARSREASAHASTNATVGSLPSTDRGYSPEVVVVLCVRGPDPFLSQTLQALAEQEYPNYRLVVVVDHRLDPAWQSVQQVKHELGLNDRQLEVQELRERRDQCGLKCSALLQAIGSLGSEPQDPERLIVTIDSDAVPAAHWLVNLVRPLVDPSVGATTSNQWFEPSSAAWGTWVRSVWQAGAIVPTAILANPWAGGFAMRQRDLEESGLLATWQTSIIDDGPVRESLQRIGKRVVFVPQNVVINREDCGLGFSLRYIRRMLTWSRLYERTFWLTGCHAVLVAGVHLWALFAALLGSVAGFTGTLSIVEAGLTWLPLALLIGGQVGGYEVVRRAVLRHTEMDPPARRSAAAASSAPGRSRPWPWRGLLVAAAIPWTLFAYTLGCIGASRVRRVVWRQIAYEVKDGRQVRMLDYRPFPTVTAQPLEHHSV